MFGKKGKKKAEKQEITENGAGDNKKRRITPKLLFFVLIFLAVLTIFGVYFFVIRKAEVKDTVGSLEKVTMGTELVTFSRNRLPEIYRRIGSINNEIILIENEIKRLEEIEKAYPLQKKITSAEIRIWKKTLKELTKSLSTAEKKIEQFYVAFKVNTEKGTELIENSKNEVGEKMDAVLVPSMEATERLKPKKKENGSLIDRVKDKIKNLI